jgi:hypothetical protein
MSFGILKHLNVKKGRAGRSRTFKINVTVYRADGLATGLTKKLHDRARRQGKDFAPNSLLVKALKSRGYCAVANVNRNYKSDFENVSSKIHKAKDRRGSGSKWSDMTCARTPTKAVKLAIASMSRRMK